MTNFTETHTTIKTSNLMHTALPMETGVWWWEDIHAFPRFFVASEDDMRDDDMGIDCTRLAPAHTLASAMAFLKAYVEQEGWQKYVWLCYAKWSFGICDKTKFTDDEDFSPETGHGSDAPYAARYVTKEHYQHKLLDAYLTHNTMDSEEVDAFFEELLGKK